MTPRRKTLDDYPRMKHAVPTLRLWFRVLFFAVSIPVMLVPRVLVWPGVYSSRRFERASRQVLYRTWAKMVLWFWGVRLTVKGPVPKAPCLVVGNHQTYLDGFIAASLLGSISISMAEMRNWPVIGTFCRWLHIIFVDRRKLRDTHRVNEQLLEAMDNGEAILLFPEGGTSAGHEVRPFKTALLEPAARYGWPVYPMTINYHPTPEGWPPVSWAVIWSDGSHIVTHMIRLLRLPRTEATVVFAAEPIQDSDRKRLAERLRQAIAAHHVSQPLEEDRETSV